MSNNSPGNENHIVTDTETPVITPPPTIVTVDTLSLQTALAKYVKVIANKNARMIVQGIRISAADDHIDLLGTDMEIALHVTVPANAITSPSNAIVADYKALLNAAKAVKDRQARLALYAEHLIVSDSGSSTHVSSFGEVGDFPQPPKRLTLEQCLATREENAPAYLAHAAVNVGEVIAVEEEFLIQMAPGLPKLKGRIDLIEIRRDPSGNSRLHLVDFKTAAKRMSPEDVDRGQLDLYAISLYHHGCSSL